MSAPTAQARAIVRDYAESPVYSPNGRRIAFDGSPNGAHGVLSPQPVGEHLRPLHQHLVPSHVWVTDPNRAG